jgi:hypothetical protein
MTAEYADKLRNQFIELYTNKYGFKPALPTVESYMSKDCDLRHMIREKIRTSR